MSNEPVGLPTEAPSLEEQIAHARQRVESQAKHVAAGFDGGSNIPELNMRRAILASLERLKRLERTPVESQRGELVDKT